MALSRLSFTVASGTIYGLIGPNGAGKTTTLSILAGLVLPSSGSAFILGMEAGPNRGGLVEKIGFASPQLSFFDYLTGAEVVSTCALLHGLKKAAAASRMNDLFALLDLQAAAGNYLYQYSHGMRQKLGIACALVHAPQVLLLDEPFLGLDPTSVYRLFRTLRHMSARGRTVVVTSHDLALVARLCDRVGILHEGSLKCEVRLPLPEGGDTAVGKPLESLLWEVVGEPECQELSWI
jgi:ABC-2 type transport system ATP-binding protein